MPTELSEDEIARKRGIVTKMYQDLDGKTDGDVAMEIAAKAVAAYKSKANVAYETKTSAEWGQIELAERDRNEGRTLDTGVAFIDEISNGIAPNDLVIVAAKTGGGKSQLLAEIARNVTEKTGDKSPRNAFLLALEAYAGEMQRRLKWPMINAAWLKAHPGQYLDWGSFSNGRYQEQLRPFEADAQLRFADKYTSLRTLYRNASTFGIDEMESAIVDNVEDNDILILDHLHYVDTDSDDKNVNEYGMQKKIVQKLRELALVRGKPIIAAAHFSKPEVGKHAAILPPMEKIMGSSDISKVATQVILIGNTSDLETDAFTLPPLPPALGLSACYPTLVRLAKSRLYGAERTSIVAVCFYDRDAGQYRKNYLLGKLRGYGTKWAPMFSDEIPYWASKSKSVIRLQRQAA